MIILFLTGVGDGGGDMTNFEYMTNWSFLWEILIKNTQKIIVEYE